METPPLAWAKRIVLLWIGRLGDVLVSTPFLDGLRRAAPKAHIVLITAKAGEGGARLLDGQKGAFPFIGQDSQVKEKGRQPVQARDVVNAQKRRLPF